MDKIKLMLLESTNDIKDELEEILINIEFIQLVGIARSEKEVAEIVESSNVDVLLINAGVEDNGYEISEKLSIIYSDLAIIILEDELQEETMHRAFFAGAKDVIIKPIIPSQLFDSIFKVYQLTKKKATIHKDTGVRINKKTKIGQVLSVFSAKGGTGKTFVATNLAVILAKKCKEKRVVLIDLDLEFGNAALSLNLLPRYTVTDIVDDIRNIDQDNIESYLTRHDSGLWVLPANIHPRQNEFIIAEHIEIILRALQNAFDYVVVDMAGGLNENINPVISATDNLLMVVTPEISSLRNNKSALITLSQLNYPRSKIKIVLNKAKRNDIKLKDVGTTLNYSIFINLTADYRHTVSSMNIGVPIVTQCPGCRLSKDLYSMADKIINPTLKR